jgi:capsular exopolysaccharide synthesis family protein
MHLKDVVAAVKRSKLLCAGVVLAFLALGAAAVELPARSYTATATLIAGPNPKSAATSSVPTVQFMLPAIVQQVETGQFRRAVLLRHPVLARVTDLGITAAAAPGTGILSVTATSRDSADVAAAANAAALELIRSPLTPLVKLQLLAPSTGAAAKSSNKTVIMGAALILGLMAAVLAALARNALRREVVEEGDLESVYGLEILGEIPKARMSSPLIGETFATREMVPVAEAFQKLVANLQVAEIFKTHPQIAVVSCLGQEGKTTVSSGLAYALALAGNKTTLIDADLRKPTVHTRFGLPLSPGLGDPEVVPSPVQPGLKTLTVVTAGQAYQHPTNVVTRRLPALLDDNRDERRIVIVDTPPLGPSAEAILISAFVSGVIFVIQPGKTDPKLLDRVLHDLRRSGVDVLGVVLNRVERQAGTYGAYYDATPTAASDIVSAGVRPISGARARSSSSSSSNG